MKLIKNKSVLLKRQAYRMTVVCVLSVIFLITGLGFVTPITAFANEANRGFSEELGAIVHQSLRISEKEDYQASLDLLLPLTERTDLNPYERATIYQMIGQYQYELDRPLMAQQAFEQARLSGGLLPHEDKNIELIIAQLMIGNGQYQEGVERLEKYLQDGGEHKAQYTELLVQACMQATDYERALPWAQIWFDAADPKERRHYDLMNYLFNQLGLPQRQEDLVKEMIEHWPDDKSLWDSWAYILGGQGRNQEAFEVTKITYSQGLIKSEQELLKVIQSYAFYDMPYQAAEILEYEMSIGRIAKTPERLRQLGGLFRDARDDARAKPILEAALREDIARLKDSGNYGGLAETLVDVGSCEESETAFKAAIEQGYEPGKAWSLIGNCLYDQTPKLDRLSCNMTNAQMTAAPISQARNGAAAAFAKVPQNSREYKNAQKWLEFIEAEIAAVDRRCDLGYHRSDELCYHKIKRAYDAAIFTGGFKLEDESCQKYVADYDAEFRSSYSKK